MENGDIYLCGGGIHRRIMQLTFDIQCQNLANFQPLEIHYANNTENLSENKELKILSQVSELLKT